MKNIFRLFLVLSVLLFSKLNAQNSDTDILLFDVSLNYSKTIIIYSEEVKDSFYIYIKLPKNYNQDTAEYYPALLLLDGDIAFPMAWSVVRYLQYGEHVPDIIIVGIGYGGLLKNDKPNRRERDYSISDFNGTKQSDGAKNFLHFIKNELVPLLSSAYRIDKTNMTLSGHSLGGLFVLHTFLKDPELFSNYVSSSPYTHYDLELLLALEEKNHTKNNDIKRRLFISRGAKEDEKEYGNPINQIVNRLKQSESDNFKMNYKIFDGTHFTTPAEALSYGLKFCFE